MTFSCSLPCETEGYLFSLLLTGVVRLPLTTQPVGEEERRPHNTLEKKIYSVYSCDPLWNKWQFYCFRRNDSTIFFFLVPITSSLRKWSCHYSHFAKGCSRGKHKNHQIYAAHNPHLVHSWTQAPRQFQRQPDLTVRIKAAILWMV
jgi:hypothetical protein